MKEAEKKYLTVKDYLVSKETFDLVYDTNHNYLITSPQPSPENIAAYYESPEYISHTDEKKSILSFLYQLVKKWSIQKKTKLIYKENNGVGSLLDVGAGTGDFLKAAKKRGWKAHGVEPNNYAATLSSKKGIKLKPTLNDFRGKQFDVVTLWHVLEHIPNLEETIVELSRLVKKDGTLIVAVPNFKSYDANYYGKYWAAYDVPRHLWHFSKEAIENLFSENFKLHRTEPMLFDSFYVSLLSEKFRTGNKFSMKAFWIGLKSNLKAKQSKEYSSHIYCFKKL